MLPYNKQKDERKNKLKKERKKEQCKEGKIERIRKRTPLLPPWKDDLF